MTTSRNSIARRLAPDHAELSRLRIEVSSWLETMLDECDRTELIGDVAIVLTELAANAIDHSESTYVAVVVGVDSSAVSIEVTNDADSTRVPSVAEWGMLSEGDRGRGLRLVRALCEEIELSGDDSVTIVRCQIQIR